MKQTPLSNLRNLLFENAWPYETCKGSTAAVLKAINFKKVSPLGKAKFPLGTIVYSPHGSPAKNKITLSHHFVPNTYRDDRNDRLSVIQSLGDQEGFDSPLNPKGRSKNRNGSQGESQTPLSRFAIQTTPSKMPRVQQETMTPGVSKRKGKGSIHQEHDPDESEFQGKKSPERKKTLPEKLA